MPSKYGISQDYPNENMVQGAIRRGTGNEINSTDPIAGVVSAGNTPIPSPDKGEMAGRKSGAKAYG